MFKKLKLYYNDFIYVLDSRKFRKAKINIRELVREVLDMWEIRNSKNLYYPNYDTDRSKIIESARKSMEDYEKLQGERFWKEMEAMAEKLKAKS
jgi:hypothetical protein